MKKLNINHAFLLLAIAFNMTACVKDDNISSQQYSEISAGFVDIDSRVDYEFTTSSGTPVSQKIAVTWAEGDKMDVYAGNVSAATKSNPVYTLSSGAGTKSAKFTGGQLKGTLVDGSTPLYAFVEKTGQTIDDANSTVSVDFTAQKGTLVDASNRDVLFANTNYNSKGNNFTLNHLMAIVRLNLNLPEAGECKISLVNRGGNDAGKVGTLYSAVTLDATTGAFKSGTTASKLETGDMTVSSGTNAYYMCLYPQTVQDLYVLVTYKSGSAYTVVIQPDKQTLEAGKLYCIDHTFYKPIKYLSSTKSHPITLMVSGADFEDADLVPGGTFETKAKAAIDYLFDVEPYKTYKEYFNVYIMPAHSNDFGYKSSVTTVTQAGTTKKQYDYTVDDFKYLNYMYNNCPDVDKSTGLKFAGLDNDFDFNKLSVGVLANTKIYFGLTSSYEVGSCIAVSSLIEGSCAWYANNETKVTNMADYRAIFLHEFGGHGFGRLVDEYWYDNNLTYSLTSENPQSLEYRHAWKVSYGKNVESANEKSKNGFYWEHMMTGTIKTYPKEGRNYEGGYVYGKGVFRPEQVSVMDDNRRYFNAYSRQLIVERILSLAKETFDYNTFVSKDVDVDPTPIYSSVQGSMVKALKPMSPPRLIELHLKSNK